VAATPVAPTTPDVFMAQKINWPPLPRMLEGAVVGRVGPAVVVAGGSRTNNFDVVWLKVNSDGSSLAKKWEMAEGVPGFLWSAGAQDGDSLITVGGKSPLAQVATARRLRWDGREGKILEEKLPDLPVALMSGSAAVLNDVLYVTGGVVAGTTSSATATATAPVPLNNKVWVLDLKKTMDGWKTLPDLPRAGVTRPVMIAQRGTLLVIGGVEKDKMTPFGVRWSAAVSLYTPGTPGEWRQGTPMPERIINPAAIPLGSQCVGLVGGVNADARFDGPWANASPTDALWIYNLVTDAWAKQPVPADLAALHKPQTLVVADRAAFLQTDNLSASDPLVATVLIGIPAAPLLSVIDSVVLGGCVGLMLTAGWLAVRGGSTLERYLVAQRQQAWWTAGSGLFAAMGLYFAMLPGTSYFSDLRGWLPLLSILPAFFVLTSLVYPVLQRL
jgi:hypothetical protein